MNETKTAFDIYHIRKILKNNGAKKSIKNISEETGEAYQNILRWNEKGDAPLSFLIKISETYNIKLETLIPKTI